MDPHQLAVEVFNKLADLYQERFMDVSLYHDTLDVLLEQLESNASVLELACGPGNLTRYMLDQRPDLQILGTDLAPKMIELARVNNPEAVFELFDQRQITRLTKKYDAIICGFGLPYLSKAEAIQFIADCALKLNSGSLLYLSTMEDLHSKSGLQRGSTGDEIFMNYHEAAYLRQALADDGFELLSEFRKAYIHNHTPTTDLILIAKK